MLLRIVREQGTGDLCKMETKNTTQAIDNTIVTEIDLLEIVKLIWNKIIFVIIGLALGMAIAFVITKFFITPQYTATSTIYIFSKTTSITSLTDLQLGSQLAKDFEIISSTRDVVESVISDMGLNTSYENLVGRISVENPTSSHMLTITVRDDDPIRAADISNAVADKLREQIADIMNTDKPSTVQRATAPKTQSSPSVKKNAMLGAMLGAMLVVAFILGSYFMDDTIKTEDDVQKYLNVKTLASIPLMRLGKDKKDISRRRSLIRKK